MISANKIRLYFVDITTFLLIALFTYAAVSKLTDYQKFQFQIGQSPLLEPFAGYIAWLVPLIELFVSVLLLITHTRLLALYASFALMATFTIYLIAITQFSDYIPCSCGGVLENMSWHTHLVFNAVFLLLAAVAATIHSTADITPTVDT